MKKIIYTLGISFLLINCSQEMVDTSNTNGVEGINLEELNNCLLYTSPSPRDS